MPKQQSEKINRKLTPAKLDIAWKKIQVKVREHCKDRGCVFCRVEGDRIEFQLRRQCLPITFLHKLDRIVATIESKRWDVRIVRIKTSGSAYEFRGQRHSATRFLCEMIREAQAVEESVTPSPSTLMQQERQLYIQQLRAAVDRYDRELAQLLEPLPCACSLPHEQRQLLDEIVAHRKQVLAELRDLHIELNDKSTRDA